MKLTLKVEVAEGFTSFHELETVVDELGQQLKRQLFETLTDKVECTPTVCPHCYESDLVRRGQRMRQLRTLFGCVSLPNTRYWCSKCQRYCAQLDYLAGQLISEALREVAIHCGMSWSFGAAARMIHKLTGVSLSPKEIQLLTEEEGHRFSEAEAKHAQQTLNQHLEQSGVYDRVDDLLEDRQGVQPTQQQKLYIQLDGVFVHGHACQESQSLEGKVGVIFTDEIEVRGQRKRLLDKEYRVSFSGSEALAQKVFAYALEKGLLDREVIVLGDGASWIGNVWLKYFRRAKYILDWWHLKEQVWRQLAEAMTDPARRKQLGRQWVAQLWQGKVAPVLASIRQQTGNPLRRLERFLKRNRNALINYQAYQQNGYYISSSMVEKAADLVVGRRQKHQGMSWARYGAEAVAALRTVFLSGKWDLYWQTQFN